jgi:hypothetical protein
MRQLATTAAEKNVSNKKKCAVNTNFTLASTRLRQAYSKTQTKDVFFTQKEQLSRAGN